MSELRIKMCKKSALKKLNKHAVKEGYGTTSNCVRMLIEKHTDINLLKEYE